MGRSRSTLLFTKRGAKVYSATESLDTLGIYDEGGGLRKDLTFAHITDFAILAFLDGCTIKDINRRFSFLYSQDFHTWH